MKTLLNRLLTGLALLVISTGVASAQTSSGDAASEKDANAKCKKKSKEESIKSIKAIASWIKSALTAGKITPKEGCAKMKACLKKSSCGKKGYDMDAIKAKIEAAIKAGKLTREEADNKLLALENKCAAKKKAYDKKKSSCSKKGYDMDAIKAKIEAMVKAGKLTSEQAQRKIEWLNKMKKSKDNAKATKCETNCAK